jgi:hypothetical protein
MTRPPLLSRVAWFVGLWLASVLALGLVAYAIRLAIPS